MRSIVRPLVSLAVFGCAAGLARSAATDALEVSVIGQIAPAYKRPKLPDGTFKPQGYTITNGGMIPGTIRDESIEKVPFPAIAEVVARHLSSQKYFLAEKAGDFDLLIVLHWGCTNGFDLTRYGQSVERNAESMVSYRDTSQKLEDLKSGLAGAAAGSEDAGKMKDAIEAMEVLKQRAADHLESSITAIDLENRARDSNNLENAKVLGYLDAINARRNVMHSRVTDADRELMRDVEEKRYFVVVTAYDFKTVRDKNKKPLWITRISIRASGNGFDERVAQMVAAAAKSLGRKTDLNRRYYGDPRVELGEIEYLGVAASASPPTREAAGKPEK